MSILVLTSDTLIGTPATGNIEYNGQFFGTDSNASRAQMQRITQGTAVASTSGTSVEFTGIPAWCKRLTVMFAGISTNGTGVIQIQLGTSGGYEISGYLSSTWTANTNNSAPTTGFAIRTSITAAFTQSGHLNLTAVGSNLWVGSGVSCRTDAADSSVYSGNKTLSGTLDRVRFIGSATGSPSDTFDAGTINILIEG